jgi:hypothetical protein
MVELKPGRSADLTERVNTQQPLNKIGTGSDSDQPKDSLQKCWVEKGLGSVLRQLLFWLVAIAPSSDFALDTLNFCLANRLGKPSSDELRPPGCRIIRRDELDFDNRH